MKIVPGKLVLSEKDWEQLRSWHLELLPEVLVTFAFNYLLWREQQNKKNKDEGVDRLFDTLVGKFGEYMLWSLAKALFSEPDYSKYNNPKFDPDLLALLTNYKIHVKMCSWEMKKYCGCDGWLVSRSDPIVDMKYDHQNNILVFGFVNEFWEVKWAGWCFVNEMYDHKRNICYYRRTYSNKYLNRKWGVWAYAPPGGYHKGQRIYGVIEDGILRPIEDLLTLVRSN